MKVQFLSVELPHWIFIQFNSTALKLSAKSRTPNGKKREHRTHNIMSLGNLTKNVIWEGGPQNDQLRKAISPEVRGGDPP